MIQYFSPDIEECGVLPEPESGHCIRVLRKKSGDEIMVTDGKGFRYKCVITSPHPKHTEVRIIEKEEIASGRDFKLTIAVAPTKNIDRIEWFVEKAVEIGIDEIVLFRCDHSERKNINIDRLEKIAVSAMKQSLKTKLPAIRGLITLSDFIAEKRGGLKFVGYCDEATPRLNLAKQITPATDVTVLIGPEGDFTPAEINNVICRGYEAVTFGDTRLRTETAALYALQCVHIVNQLK